jgi:hypothetical protein
MESSHRVGVALISDEFDHSHSVFRLKELETEKLAERVDSQIATALAAREFILIAVLNDVAHVSAANNLYIQKPGQKYLPGACLNDRLLFGVSSRCHFRLTKVTACRFFGRTRRSTLHPVTPVLG